MLKENAPASIFGWGKQPGEIGYSDELMAADIELGLLMLAGTDIAYTDVDAGPCSQDSGSPLAAMDANGELVLLGVASATRGNLCSKGGGRAFYTNIAGLRNFIESLADDMPVTEAPEKLLRTRNQGDDESLR